MSSQDSTPSLPTVLATVLERALTRARVCLPGKVISYNAAQQSVDVQPVIRELFEDEEGENLYETLPVIPGVPVAFPSGGGFRVTFPIQPGDHVTLIFADRSIDSWLAQGGILNPTPGRSHDLADAIAIPGIRTFKTPLQGASATTMSVGSDTGASIEFTGSEIQAGGTQSLALKSDVQALANWIDGLPVGGTGSAPAPGAPGGTGTSILKGA